jgi:4-nitrophenyl phosphatase
MGSSLDGATIGATVATTDLHALAGVVAVLFDMDGVLYVGNQPLPGVQELWDYLDASGRRRLCVTNNASLGGAQFAAKLGKMGLRTEPGDVLGSADATAAWLAEQVADGAQGDFPPGAVFVMGMEGLRNALESAGFTLTDDPLAATYCVAGANFHLTYNDLADATLAIRNGARFVGTNPDVTFPTERGQIPGTGSVLALLAAASGVQPIVIGKPNAPMFHLAMERLAATPATTLMVGDRYDTDIAGAAQLGMLTAGVLTGVSSREAMLAGNPPPAFLLAGLPELLHAFRQADAHA